MPNGLESSFSGEKGRDDDEGPVHKVTISRPFYMGKYEVTQAQWEAVMGTKPWSGQGWAKDHPDHAASWVSWDDAKSFCEKLSAKAGKTIRLPTEGEWEYACRSASQTRFCYGDDRALARLGDYAWYDKNAVDVAEGYTHRVGQKKPSSWGLHDMHGNVWEWCADRYGPYAIGDTTDSIRSLAGSVRVLRGGSWNDDARSCRAAFRGSLAEAQYAAGAGERQKLAAVNHDLEVHRTRGAQRPAGERLARGPASALDMAADQVILISWER